MTPPGKDDEGKKTSPDTEAEETDPGAGKDDGREDAPVRKAPEETEPEREADASEKPAQPGDEAGPAAEDREPDEPAEQGPVDKIGDPDLHEPDGPAAEEEPKQSEPVTAATAAPPPARQSGGRFGTALLGAVVGVAVGAAVVWFVLQQMPREPEPEVTAALDRQQEEIAAQGDTIATLEGEIQALTEELGATDLAGTVDALRGDTEARLGSLDESLSGLAGRIDTMESRLDEIGGRFADVESRLDEGETRITELEARPVADPETANQVLRSEIADMRAEVEQATEDARAQVDTMRNELSEAAAATQAEIEAAEQRAAELEEQARERAAAAEAEAQATARAAAAQAALAQIRAALDSGEPYGEALATLSANAEAEVPEALAAPAEAGVPTLGELRESYADAARDALSASRVATSEGDPGSRVMAFLRTQTGARSLTPQEGDSPDAVLSRAEAALDEGDVTAALAELEALPENGRAAMQDWIESAGVRADAAAAADTLSQGMN